MKSYVTESYTKGLHRPRLIIHDDEVPEQELEFALKLISHFGAVAGIPEGEDAAGRSKLRLQTPGELVERSFAIAKLAFEHARREKLFVKMPLPEPEKAE